MELGTFSGIRNGVMNFFLPWSYELYFLFIIPRITTFLIAFLIPLEIMELGMELGKKKFIIPFLIPFNKLWN